jgi:hypothetical protein
MEQAIGFFGFLILVWIIADCFAAEWRMRGR